MDHQHEVLEISPPHGHSPNQLHSTSEIYHEVHDNQKGIKCDIMLYPILKDDQQYDSWYHKAHAIASVHAQKPFLTETIAP